jgi:hypothetical protein
MIDDMDTMISPEVESKRFERPDQVSVSHRGFKTCSCETAIIKRSGAPYVSLPAGRSALISLQTPVDTKL